MVSIFSLTRRGFTLIELLVVIAILGILTTLGAVSFGSAQQKARDGKRKNDLNTIAKALEAYYNDHSSYPLSNAGDFACTPPATCAWESSLTDANGTLYLATIPTDSRSDRRYYYHSDGASYTLSTCLENTLDPALNSELTLDCGPTLKCNYQLKSTNQL